MTVCEVLDRLTAARRCEADSRMFALSASSLPHMAKKGDREAVFDRVQRLGRSGVERRDALDLLDPESRIIQIGGLLARHDEGFARRHSVAGCRGTWADFNPRWTAWLRDQGVTPEEAIARHREWLRRTFDEDPFFARERAERAERKAKRLRRLRGEED